MKIINISRDGLSKLMDSGERFKLIDVLATEHFAKEHIKGAISLPINELEKNSRKILPDKNEKIVVYCASFECQASTNAAKKLIDLGYTDVLDYKGGIKDYKEAGRSLAGSLYERTQKLQQICSECYTC